MLYVARCNAANLVQFVTPIDDGHAPTREDGEAWITLYAQQYGAAAPGVHMDAGDYWKATSYLGSYRGKFAGVGDKYNPATDVFEVAP